MNEDCFFGYCFYRYQRKDKNNFTYFYIHNRLLCVKALLHYSELTKELIKNYDNINEKKHH